MSEDREQQAAWLDLSARATALLRGNGFDSGLRLGVFPSFQDAYVIEVSSRWLDASPTRERSRKADHHTVISWRTWKMSDDGAKLADVALRLAGVHPLKRSAAPRPILEPTIEVRETPIERTELDQLLRGLASVRIPVLPDDPAGTLDGSRYELDATCAMHSVRLKWSSERPSEWRPVMEWFGKTLEWLTERTGRHQTRP